MVASYQRLLPAIFHSNFQNAHAFSVPPTIVKNVQRVQIPSSLVNKFQKKIDQLQQDVTGSQLYMFVVLWYELILITATRVLVTGMYHARAP